MSDALIKACKREARHVHEYPSRLLVMAADALTAAQEENERLVHDIERLSTSLSAEVTGSERLREALSLMANRLRHEITIKPDLTFNDAIEWVEELTRAALNGLPR